MIIERQNRTYFAPDDATALDASGSWSALPHAKLLPVEIKALQDRAAVMRMKVPTDADLLMWAKLNHPSYSSNAQADAVQAKADAAWADYIAKMKAQGLSLPDAAPQYGGL